MSNVQYQTVIAEEVGQRLDNYLLRVLKGVPRSHIYRLIRGGEVRINKKRAKPSTRLVLDDLIRIPPVRTTPEKTVFVSQRTQASLLASIVHEDAQFIVLNKPAGIAVHGGSGVSLGVIEALRALRPELAYLELVHRLDRDTSGCLLLAKKRSVLRAIQAELVARRVDKQYWAISYGHWQGQTTCQVKVPLQKNTLQSGERMVRVDPQGKPSDTLFRLLENFSDACWLEVHPKTGRTHQIRVHSAYLGHAIIGDDKYASQHSAQQFTQLSPRLYLHARSIRFNLNGIEYVFQAELDTAFAQALALLRHRECQNEAI
jgi:23S rRNA pseudouridine955/2504/2580 synthase